MARRFQSRNAATRIRSAALAHPEPLESRLPLTAAAWPLLNPHAVFSFGPVAAETASPNQGDFVGSIPVSSLAAGAAGIAVTGVDASAGRLFFSTDGGGSWSDVTAVSGRSALILHATPQTRLLFRPHANTPLTAAEAVIFRAWDGTGGHANGALEVDTLFVPSQVVRQIPTADAAVAAAVPPDESFALIAERGAGIRVISLVGAARGQTLATLDTPGAAVAVAIAGNGRQAYVAADYGGLAVVDLTSPSAPRLSASLATSGYAYGVAATAGGRYVYVAAGLGGLDIVDLLAAGGPRVVRTVPLGSYALGVAASADGRYAFVANSAGTLQVIDAANPATASIVRTVTLGGSPEGIAVGPAGLAIVACGQQGVRIVSTATPAAAAVVGSIDTPGRALAAVFSATGDRAYVADGTGTIVLDLATATTPRITGSLDGAVGSLGAARGPGGLVVVADGAAGTLVIDTARPNSTAVVPTTGGAKRLAVRPDGAYAFVADNTAGLQVIRTSGIGTETIVGSLDTGRVASDVAVSATGRYAYVADTMTGLVVVDALNPAAPQSVSVITEVINAVAVATSADGRYAYVGDRFNGLAIYDLLNPAAPQKVKGIAGAWPVRDVAVAPDGRLAVLAVDANGIEIFDVATPAQSRSIARVSLDGETAVAVAIGADSQTAYAVTTAGRLHVVNLATVNVVARLTLGTTATGIGLSPDGTRGFITLGSAGVGVVDFSLPERPLLLGILATPGEPQSAAVTADGRLFVAANSGGLTVQDVSPLAGFSRTGAAISAILGGLIEDRGNVPLTRDAAGSWMAGAATITGESLAGITARWQFLEAEVEDGTRFVTARDRAGGLLRLVADETWRLVGFAGIRNATSSLLPIAVRGDAAPPDGATPSLPENVTVPIDLTGAVFLRRNGIGNLYAGMTPITHGQEPLNQAALAGAVAIAAESLPAGNRLLLRTAAGGLVVWRFNEAWQFSSADVEVAPGTAAASLLALEFGLRL